MKKTIAIILSFILAVTSLPLAIFAEELNTVEKVIMQDERKEEQTKASKDTVVISEDVSRRDEFTKHFLMSDGSYVAVQYAEPVHVLDESGEWENVDNTLSFAKSASDGDFDGYVNEKGNFDVKFAADASKDVLFRISDDDNKIAFSVAEDIIVNEKSAVAEIAENKESEPKSTDKTSVTVDDICIPEELNSEIRYPNMMNDIDFEYKVTPSGVKENIIINKPQDEYEFSFIVNTDGLEAELKDDGCIYLGEKYIIPAPFMYDADNAFSDNAYYEFEKCEEGYCLTIKVDDEWINDIERAFPVIVDPEIVFDSDYSGINIYNVDSANPDATLDTRVFSKTGASSTSIKRTFVTFAKPQIGDYSIVDSAKIHFYVSGGIGNDRKLVTHKVTDQLHVPDLTWNNQPSFDSVIMDYNDAEEFSNGIEFDVTEIAKDLMETGYSHGFAITMYNETPSVNNEISFLTKMVLPPYIKLHYNDQSGLHDEYSYTTFSAGNAGTAYINNYNGSLVVVREDCVSQSDVLPFSLNHIYDSHFADSQFYDSMKVGKGWKLSLQEKIESISIGGQTYYKYVNEAFNTIYFMEEDGSYTDVDDKGYSLTANQDGTFNVECPNGITKVFASGFITGVYVIVSESDGDNQITYTYQNGKLITVTDPSNCSATLSYNESDQLAEITVGSRSFEFEYDENDNLKTISDSYVQHYCLYNYSGALTLCRDQLGKSVGFTRSNGANWRISNCSSYVYNESNSVAWNGCSFSYLNVDNFPFGLALTGGSKQTKVTLYGNDGQSNTADDITEYYLFDNAGRVIVNYAENSDGDIISTLSYGNEVQVNALGNIYGSVSETGYVASDAVRWNFESSTWTLDASSATISRVSSDSLYGHYSMKCEFPSTGLTDKILSDSVSSTVEKHTASVYLKCVDGITNGGIRLAVYSQSGNLIAQSEQISRTYENVDNGWARVYVEYESTESSVKLGLVCSGSGTFYADAAMLEVSTTLTPSVFPEYYENFDGGVGSWIKLSNNISLSTENDNSMKVIGDMSEVLVAYKTIPVSSDLRSFVLSGWAQADSLPIDENNNRHFELFAVIQYHNANNTSNYTDKVVIPFDWTNTARQYVSGIVDNIPNDAVGLDSITVGIKYMGNLNTAYFDDIILTRSDPVDVTDYADIEPIINGATKIYNYSDGTSVEELYWDDTFEVLKSETFKENGVTTAVYSYDNQGVLTSLTEYEGDDVILTSYTYSNGNLTSATTTKNNVETAYEEYDYDSDGNQISSAIRKNGKTITTSCTYANGKLVSSTDPRDNTSTISYANGLLQTMTNANGIATRYTYANNRITSYYLDEDMNEAFTQGEKRIQYYYDTYGRISYYMTGAGNYYGYSYNSAGLLSSVNLANRTLITFEYNSAYTQLIGYSYGSVVKTYEYDIYGNLITIKHNFSPRYTFKYNCLGLLESVTDAETGIVRHYSYDIDGNQWNYYESGANYNYSLGEVEVNDVSTLMYSIDGNDYSCYNDYDDTTNTNSYVLPSGASISGESDDFGRSSSTVISDADGNALVEYDIGYEEWTDGNNVLRTSELVSSFDVNGKTYTYTYDANCNITSVSIDGVLADTYTYDAAGQLIRDDSAAQDKTITYTYNNSGNVSIIKEYAYTLGNLGSVLSTRSFGYNAAIDTMFNYNGITVNYDSSGNPLNWRDGMTFTWEGRELKTATANGKTYQYYYNSDGIRTRTIEKNGILHYYHDYILDGTKILAEKIYTVIQGNVLPATTKIYVYLYDGNDSPIGIKHGNDYYYFTKNLQGDITGIVDSSGTSVVEYTYDVWGSILSASGSLASTLGVINIFRYRGYVYDTATKLYYLQSRYYDPDCGRFLNPDDTQYLGASGTVLGWNLYSYCENNAVNSIDPKGRDAVLLIQTGGAYGFGHAGLLIEKNNEWYYFSVSGKQQNHSMLIDYHYLGQGKSITRRILNGGVTFVNSLINKVAKSSPQQRFYREVYIAGVYNHMHYFTGSFYLSLEESKRVYRRHDKYNVFSNNCLTVAVELLQKGKCTGPLANEYNTAIKLLSYLYIPNDAEFALSYFESTINAYLIAQKGNWLTRLIFYLRYKDPYYYFTHPVSSSLY